MNKTSSGTSSAKHYVIYDSNNDLWYDDVHGLAQFCIQHNLSDSGMRDVSKGRQKYQHRGFFCSYKTPHAKEIIQLKIDQKRLADLTIRINKLKKPFSKQFRYNQSDGYVNFQKHVADYYQSYHIEQKLSCEQIADKLQTYSEAVRLLFHKHGLKVFKHTRPKSGFQHYAFLKLNESSKQFLYNFKELFEKHHHEEKLSVNEIAELYDLSPMTIFNRCHQEGIEYSIINATSKPHRILIQELKDLRFSPQVNNRKLISPKELDIVLNDHLAIEINGLYWHSMLKKNYHLEKLNQCNQIALKLLQFWDTEILNKLPIVLSIINNNNNRTQKLYARHTVIRQLNISDATRFFEENHIMGNVPGRVSFGLFHGDELVSAMAFKKNPKYQYELVRFSNKLNTLVVGGAQKLFSQFISTVKPDSVVSYCDKRLFDGRVYDKLKFRHSHDSTPNYWYFHQNQYQLSSRLKYQKHKLKGLLKKFDPNLSEWQNMRNNGFCRVYDCGNKVYEWRRN